MKDECIGCGYKNVELTDKGLCRVCTERHCSSGLEITNADLDGVARRPHRPKRTYVATTHIGGAELRIAKCMICHDETTMKEVYDWWLNIHGMRENDLFKFLQDVTITEAQ